MVHFQKLVTNSPSLGVNLHSAVELGACFWGIMCSEFQTMAYKTSREKWGHELAQWHSPLVTHLMFKYGPGKGDQNICLFCYSKSGRELFGNMYYVMVMGVKFMIQVSPGKCLQHCFYFLPKPLWLRLSRLVELRYIYIYIYLLIIYIKIYIKLSPNII